MPAVDITELAMRREVPPHKKSVTQITPKGEYIPSTMKFRN